MNTLIKKLTGLITVLLFLGVTACDSVDNKDKNAQDPLWSEYLSQHTSGSISRRSTIKIRFVNDVIEERQIDEDASQVISIKPSIKAKITFNGRREILIKPGQYLESGQHYQVEVKKASLKNIPEQLSSYKFSFDVIKQDFEVNIVGLMSGIDNTQTSWLLGSVVTADVASNEKVEEILSAEYLGDQLKIDWEHSEDGLSHEFSIHDIKRYDIERSVYLRWNGSSVGVDNDGEHTIDVPAINDFKVINVQAVKDDRQYISVKFSEPLDTAQNMEGLIYLKNKKSSMRIEGDKVKLFPEYTGEGKYKVVIEQGIKNSLGAQLKKRDEYEIFFESQKPEVRFTGTGVILPENQFLTVPFEAINVKSVQVSAFLVFENNMGQFLQANKLSGSRDLKRVGRFLWRKTIALDKFEFNKWNRYSLDATQLLKSYPGSLFQLHLSINRGDAVITCSTEDEQVPLPKDQPLQNYDDLSVISVSNWDYYEDYYGVNNNSWRDRNDPCKDSYYKRSRKAKSKRNFIASNIGLIAKYDGRNKLSVVSTNLKTSEPISDTQVKVYNFQNQLIGSAKTDPNGMIEVQTDGTPFYVAAENGGQKGYLKVNKATALPTSHFDVGGEKVKQGIKGYIYGERDVWRPGDDIYLTFVLEDKEDVIPESHPVTMQLRNPKNQLIHTQVNNKPVGDFYAFKLKTSDDAVTGNWKATAIMGGNRFTKKVKIETVIPNRLKIELSFDKETLKQDEMPFDGRIFSEWLHGATAAGLKTDVSVQLKPITTKFTRSADFNFDDPTRKFSSEPKIIYEGKLNESGYADFAANVDFDVESPGMLKAYFTTRVFEQGGAFSTSRTSLPYAPYKNYVGIKLPKGDEARGMLLTDVKHTVEVASLDASGEPVSLDSVSMSIYKIDWKWWWDKSGESLAKYARSRHSRLVDSGAASTENGLGQWQFEIKYPNWGRYLIRACNESGRHCTAQIFYIDWPGWAGRAREGSGAAANSLSFTADKQQYNVGDVAKIKLPEATQGRALLSVETGSILIEQRWLKLSDQNTEFELPITKAMSPNVYVNITLIQPHQGKDNDRPIRLYGVIPIMVKDPETILSPVLDAADEWEPVTKVKLNVSEQHGKEMTYTVAVVDEGLLGLTAFKTPDLHKHFYKKEALGVLTWDLFDYVTGAYGGDLERLLALGGGDKADKLDAEQDKKRFPPVVRYIGPFKLEANSNNQHEIDLPQYIGAVRVMVVAGEQGAYGKTEKSVFVRGALSLLPTLPRVVGPDESLYVPVSVFAMQDDIKEVGLKVKASEHFELFDKAKQSITFEKQGDVLSLTRLKVKTQIGKGNVKFEAEAGKYHAESEINIDIRSPNPKTLRQKTYTLEPGDRWEEKLKPHGIEGTNEIDLEVSTIPPFNLERRLKYLIRYPHGCVEQVTSAVFPQLYLPSLMRLDQKRTQQIQNNVHAGIGRLRGFQVGGGAFVYWPGGFYNGGVNTWVTSYVGHFLVEAKKLGYHVPSDMYSAWLSAQSQAAKSWVTGGTASTLDQAYRLYTLALANEPDIAAMNRLRNASRLSSVARWQLAAAYRLSGLSTAAEDLVKGDRYVINDYARPGDTFGSKLRDKALILNGLVLIGEAKEAQRLAEEISSELYVDKWYSTQTVAHALASLAKFVGQGAEGTPAKFSFKANGHAEETLEMSEPIFVQPLKDFPIEGGEVQLKNLAKQKLYVSLLSYGSPKAGDEIASSNSLRIGVRYETLNGGDLDPKNIAQGTDFVAKIKIKNLTDEEFTDLALTHIVASGWEIHNPRFSEQGSVNDSIDYQDIRDDRLYSYFGLKGLEEKEFTVLLNATYLGRFYMPSISVEAMYDARHQARTQGQWVNISKASD